MPAIKRIFAKLLPSTLRILAGVPIVSLLGGGLLFLLFSETLKGRSVGLSAVLLGSLLYSSVAFWRRTWFQKIRGRVFAALIPTALVLYIVPMILAPSGGRADARFRNCFLHNGGAFSRYSTWNVIPEVDQIKVGMCLLPFGDRYVDFAKAVRMRSLVLPIYEEMDRDTDFRAIGSNLSAAYRELFHMECRPGHYYLCLPEAAGNEKLPCLIFLHGLGGNTKACVWLLSRMATREKCILIAPTFGIGNWDKSGSAEFVVHVAHEAIETLPVDPERIFLMGYSNGAMGVTRAALREADLFKGLIYLSAVTEDEFFATKEFLAGLQHRKMLFLHGESDERIPQNLIQGTVASLKGQGFNVHLKIYNEEDHYLLFSQPQAVLADIAEFIKAD
jgi:predicted esterase